MIEIVAYGSFSNDEISQTITLFTKYIIAPWVNVLILSYLVEKSYNTIYAIIIYTLYFGISTQLGVMGAWGPIHVMKPFIDLSFSLSVIYLIIKTLIVKQKNRNE